MSNNTTCNCIKEKTDAVKKHVIDNCHFKKEVEAARMKSVAITFPNFEPRSYSEIEFELNGQKKKPTIQLFHSYCPFCGIEINKGA